MQSLSQRVPYVENSIFVFEMEGNLVRNPSDTQKTCSQYWEALLAFIAIATDPQYLDEAIGLPQWYAVANSDMDFIRIRLQSKSCMH